MVPYPLTQTCKVPRYGLGANGLDPEAVLQIFEAKGRCASENLGGLQGQGPDQYQDLTWSVFKLAGGVQLYCCCDILC